MLDTHWGCRNLLLGWLALGNSGWERERGRETRALALPYIREGRKGRLKGLRAQGLKA